MTVQQRELADRMIADVRRSIGEPMENPEASNTLVPEVVEGSEPGQKRMMTRTDDKSFALGALAVFTLGMASGAALTLLYAPASGETTRESIGRGARQARNQVAAAAQKASTSLSRAVKPLRRS